MSDMTVAFGVVPLPIFTEMMICGLFFFNTFLAITIFVSNYLSQLNMFINTSVV